MLFYVRESIKALLFLLASVPSLFTMSSVETVAYTIAAEARGEGEVGMTAVANVIQKRSSDRRISLSSACTQKYQFSSWVDGKPAQNYDRVVSDPNYPVALRLARQMVSGQGIPVVVNADHFFSGKVVPKWAKGKSPVAVIGHHTFYDL